MQLADSQERHAQLDERVIEAERKVAESREQQRSLERQAQEAQFSQRSLQARRGELQRAIATAVQQAETSARSPAASSSGRALAQQFCASSQPPKKRCAQCCKPRVLASW